MNRRTPALTLFVLAGASVTTVSGQQTTFRATAQAVSVPVSVRDKNRPVVGLTAADFDVQDNGVPQTIAAVSLSSVPIDVTMLMDASASVAGRNLARFKEDVQSMSDQLETGDRIRLLTFAGSTTDVFGLKPAGVRLPLDAIGGGGVTALYDAVAAAIVVVSANERPQVIFAFTDGMDSASAFDSARLQVLSRLSSAPLYLVLANAAGNDEYRDISEMAGHATGYVGHGSYAGGPDRGALRSIAERTGGALYETRPGDALPATFKRLLDDFRTGYVLSFSPTGVSASGWHDLQVHAKNSSYAVKARAGYNGG
jgi:VWFA-related protein